MTIVLGAARLTSSDLASVMIVFSRYARATRFARDDRVNKRGHNSNNTTATTQQQHTIR